jgi:maltose alpha-D-glucosyltransferase/alpha-amylase
MSKWYNNVVVYGLDVGVFNDSNGDGIGDFKGATQKLDYLAHMGINCIWLLPFFLSPEKDNGYDVKDYYQINPDFGSLDDFVEFLQEAEKRSIRVLLDLVINHTSSEHPWFKAAQANKKSAYYNYYIWSKEAPAESPENVFKGEESSTWKYEEHTKEFYYHKFYHFEPDLNIGNKRVREEIKHIMEYWLSFGISGFRIDAATHLFKKLTPEKGEPSPEQFMQELHSFVRELKEDAILLAEADVPVDEISKYWGDGNRMHMLFNFLLNNSLMYSLAIEKTAPLVERIKELPELPEGVHWVNFIRNLDELDLERLKPDEREKVMDVFAPNPLMQIYGRGIRRRIAPMLQGNLKRLKMVYSLLFALPGSPMIAYGDEIGMGDNLVYNERQCVRTPMQWTGEKNGGFSERDTHEIRIPPINQSIFSYIYINVENQLEDSGSLLNATKELIKLRISHKMIGQQKPGIINTGDEAVLGLKYKHEQEDLLMFFNLSADQKLIEVKLNIKDYYPLTGDGPYGIQENKHALSLREWGYRWFKKT